MTKILLHSVILHLKVLLLSLLYSLQDLLTASRGSEIFHIPLCEKIATFIDASTGSSSSKALVQSNSL